LNKLKTALHGFFDQVQHITALHGFFELVLHFLASSKHFFWITDSSIGSLTIYLKIAILRNSINCAGLKSYSLSWAKNKESCPFTLKKIQKL
jgi:hypothetical protein